MTLGIGVVVALASSVCVAALVDAVAADAVTAAPAVPGTFVSLSPTRVLDTGQGIGAPRAPVAARSTTSVKVAGRGGVPTSGVSSVVLNVTVASPQAGGHVTVFPGGTARPATSSLNFVTGRTVANAVVTQIGNGSVSLYNSASRSVRLIADVSGYYVSGAPAVAGSFTSLAPARVLDTGSGNGAPEAPVGAGRTINVQVAGRGGVPASGAVSVVLNLTAAKPLAGGHITAYPQGSSRPDTSSLNFTKGQTVPNLVVVRLGSSGQVSLYNSARAGVRLIADVAGYYLSGRPTTPGVFQTLSPARFLDTATGNGARKAPVAGGSTLNVQITGRGLVPASGVSAVVLNVTVASPMAGGHLTVFPPGVPRPTTSNVNFTVGHTVANLVVAKLGANGQVSLYNSARRSVRLVADVAGYFLAGPASSVPAGPGPVLQTTAQMPTADPLPTTQIDGVGWKQAVVGDTVYVGGSFANARPAGAAPGVDTVPRTDLLAYDITTGVLINSFRPVLNGQVLDLSVSPDRKRLYAVGDFTTVNGARHVRIAAFSATTGALIPSFTGSLNSTGRAVFATNTAVYAGGNFSQADGVSRAHLAAFTRAGGLSRWAPKADAVVNGMVADESGEQIDVAGAFTTLAGATVYGLGAVSATSGASVAFAANRTLRAYGQHAGFTSLSLSGNTVYGTAYNYHGNGTTEGVFAADSSTGAIIWLDNCHGDTYGAFATDGAVYTVGHAHYCSDLGGWPLYAKQQYRRTIAFTRAATGTLLADTTGYPSHTGVPSPSIYEWFPDLPDGTATGQHQAAWAVSGNSDYVVEAGEFPSVNAVPQEGLVRFAARPTAPGLSGPSLNGAKLNPELTTRTADSIHVAFQADWDRDDHVLNYQLIRDNNTAAPILTGTVNATWWDRPMIGFTDTNLTPGQTYGYRVVYTDSDGNTTSSATVQTTPAATTSLSAYDQQVIADGALSYWPLDEPDGTLGRDYAGADTLDLSAGVTRSEAGPVPGESASTFSGTSTGLAVNRAPVPAPTTFSLSAWVRTTTTSGGKIIGFGDNPESLSTTFDRQIYLGNDGRVNFGVTGSGKRALLTSSQAVNDGQWHQIVATFAPNAMVLYIDGVSVTSRADIVPASPVYNGWWRIGGDSMTKWANLPSSNYLAGDIGSVAVFPSAITAATVQSEYQASGR